MPFIDSAIRRTTQPAVHRIIRLLLLTCLCQVLPVQAIPAAWDKRGQVWKTLESEHFDVHFSDGYQPMAQRALDIAEQVHTELVPFFGQAPDERTQMVLVDDFDYSNGWATPLPFVQIRLFASPPEEVAGLDHMDEWLHGLIRHEYVHILHLNMASRTVTTLRNVFGNYPLLYPHLFTPSFFTEGLAVYLETNHDAGYGRLDSPFFAMQMKADVQAQGADDLNQVIVPLRDWPGGKHYVYGAYFWQFLAEQYGEARMRQYLKSYSGELIPWFFQNRKARQVFGKSFSTLWRDYQQWLAVRFSATEPPTSSQSLTTGSPAGGIGQPPLLPGRRQVTVADGADLLQVVNNGEDRPTLMRITPQAGGWQAQSLASLADVTDMDIAADGTLVVSRLLSHADGRDLNDLFLWREQDGLTRLTENSRLRKARWLPDGQSLIASRKELGLSELWQVGRDGSQQRLWRGATDVVLGEFDVSPDGQALVASVKRPQQGWNLERFDLNRRQWQALTDTKASENAPEFLPDGRILFSADYQGVYNLWVLTPESGRLERWSDETTGAFSPRWAAGRVFYQAYTSEGYMLRCLCQTPASAAPLAVSQLADVQGRYDYPRVAPDPVASELSDYSPWPTLRPRYWFPLAGVDEHSVYAGAVTSSNDAVGRHAYSVAATWDFTQNWADFTAQYLYDTRWLLLWNRSHSFDELNLDLPDDYLASREDLVILQRDHLWDAFEDQLQLHAGVTADHEKIVRSPAYITTGSGYEETLAGIALTFDNREFYRNVPDVGWGTYADLVYETNDVLNSDFSGAQWQASVKRTFDLPGRQTLALGLAGGVADREAEPFAIGGTGGEDALLFGRDQFALPGYDDGVEIGHKYYNGVLRYTRFISRVERNWGFMPLGLGDISASVWTQTASAWFREQHRPSLTAVGAELGVDVVLGYHLPLPLRAGLARGLNETAGLSQFYLRLQAAF
ncbi:hypothetical protein ACQUQU_11715 [Thalassolituus sp. LLYu03]|uniref:TolB family protein n=1 Tax=Thalassolituus sp. LLYu03 TaxID=3421656 RepID=UPI003D28A6AB